MASSGLSGPAMDPAVTDLLDDWLDQFDAALLAPGRFGTGSSRNCMTGCSAPQNDIWRTG